MTAPGELWATSHLQPPESSPALPDPSGRRWAAGDTHPDTTLQDQVGPRTHNVVCVCVCVGVGAHTHTAYIKTHVYNYTDRLHVYLCLCLCLYTGTTWSATSMSPSWRRWTSPTPSSLSSAVLNRAWWRVSGRTTAMNHRCPHTNAKTTHNNNKVLHSLLQQKHFLSSVLPMSQ